MPSTRSLLWYPQYVHDKLVASFSCPYCKHREGTAYNVLEHGYVVGVIIECRRCFESELTYFGPAPEHKGTGAIPESETW